MSYQKLLICLMMLSSFALQAREKFDFVVAKDGTGDFKTVQEVIQAIPDMRANRTLIFIKKGIYKEKLTLHRSRMVITSLSDIVNLRFLLLVFTFSRECSFMVLSNSLKNSSTIK